MSGTVALVRLALPLCAVAAVASPACAAPTALVDRLHARAVDSFRQGRFPEAYGRFIDLANMGHPASARYALWMCEHGPTLFGRDWDCAPHDVEDWAAFAGVARPETVARVLAKPPAQTRTARR